MLGHPSLMSLERSFSINLHAGAIWNARSLPPAINCLYRSLGDELASQLSALHPQQILPGLSRASGYSAAHPRVHVRSYWLVIL
jgi:hypothetical protein